MFRSSLIASLERLRSPMGVAFGRCDGTARAYRGPACTDPKIPGEWAGGSIPGRLVGRVGGGCWSGGGFEGDFVAEGFELADVVALAVVGVDAPVVEVGAQVVEAGLGVGQQVPDDDQ